MSKRDFDKLLLEAVDEALSTLGESLKETTYHQLEESFSIKKHEIPFKTATFTKAIEEIFGNDAGDVEILILQKLYGKVGGVFERYKSSELSFGGHLKRAHGRLYEDFVNSMQSGVAVFYFENMEDLGSFDLIAANSVAAKIAGMPVDKLLGKTVAESYPGILKVGFQKMLADVIRSKKAKNLGEIHSRDEGAPESHLSVAGFPLSNDCVGLVFKNVIEQKQTEKVLGKDEEQLQDAVASTGEWKFEPDTQWRQVYSGHSRAREQWMRKKITGESRRAEYLSLRGRECLEDKDFARARQFFGEAEEAYQEFNKTEEAFENASLQIKTYVLEEAVDLQQYLDAAEKYFRRYAEFSMHGYFIENLAYNCQWKGYKYSEERKFDDARKSCSEAEEIFWTLKKEENALFNASRCVFTYKSENNTETYAKAAEGLFEKYKELSGNRDYKEIRAHYCLFKADESRDTFKSIEFLDLAERLFLETNQRELAFQTSCKKIDLHWISISSKDERSVKRCFEATERFFEDYKDFSERDDFRKRLAEYYLFQARALASQLQTALR